MRTNLDPILGNFVVCVVESSESDLLTARFSWWVVSIFNFCWELSLSKRFFSFCGIFSRAFSGDSSPFGFHKVLFFQPIELFPKMSSYKRVFGWQWLIHFLVNSDYGWIFDFLSEDPYSLHLFWREISLCCQCQTRHFWSSIKL